MDIVVDTLFSEDGGFSTVTTGRDATTVLSIEHDDETIVLSLNARGETRRCLSESDWMQSKRAVRKTLIGFAREIEGDREK